MKKKDFAIIGCLMAFSGALTSCSNTSDKATLKFDEYNGSAAYSLLNTASLLGQDTDAVYADSVSLVLPLKLGACDVKALRDTITAYALNQTGKPIAASVDTWLDATASDLGYKTERTKKVNPYTADGFTVVSGFIANMTPEMLVYCVRNESYMVRAAHGMTTRRYINYLMRDGGKVLSLDDLFTAEGLAALPSRIAEQAQAMSDMIGQTSIDALPENKNYYISSESEIVFSYQPYEVASFAQGTIDIPFYPYELVDYMTPQAITLFHLEDLK